MIRQQVKTKQNSVLKYCVFQYCTVHGFRNSDKGTDALSCVTEQMWWLRSLSCQPAQQYIPLLWCSALLVAVLKQPHAIYKANPTHNKTPTAPKSAAAPTPT